MPTVLIFEAPVYSLKNEPAILGVVEEEGKEGTGTPEPDADGSPAKLLLWHDASCRKCIYILAPEHEDELLCLRRGTSVEIRSRCAIVHFTDRRETRTPETFRAL